MQKLPQESCMPLDGPAPPSFRTIESSQRTVCSPGGRPHPAVSFDMSDNEKNAASIEEKVEVERSAPSPSYTEDEERALVRKLDWRIMPIACIMYLFACECSFQHQYRWPAFPNIVLSLLLRFGPNESGQRSTPRSPAGHPRR